MIDYSGNTVGNMAVAKSMQITTVNAVAGDEDVDYADGQSMAQMKAAEVPANIRVVKGMAPSASLTTGDTGGN